MSKGFDDLQLMELGFKQKFTYGDNEEYYYEFYSDGINIVTKQTNKELKKGEMFTLIVLNNLQEKELRDVREFRAITQIFSR
jgi:hypothetical protein